MYRCDVSATGMRGFHVLPLADDEGRVGVLSFESSNPDFLSEAHLEMIKVLGSQATVALRNASLYKEVPFIGVLQPFVDKKRRFLALETHRRAMLIGVAIAVVLFLIAFPLPLRVDGGAVVAPDRSAHVGSEFEGVIKEVNVREGDYVREGSVLASLEDWDYRSALAAAKAKHETAVLQMDRATQESVQCFGFGKDAVFCIFGKNLLFFVADATTTQKLHLTLTFCLTNVAAG